MSSLNVKTSKINDANTKTPKIIKSTKVTKPNKTTEQNEKKKKQALEKKRENLKIKLVKIPGIGAAKANELIEAGVKTPKDLKLPKFRSMLTDETILAVKYPIERELSWDYVHSLLSQLPSYLIGVGSYRRKKQVLGDIDILTTKELSVVIDEIKQRAKHIDPVTEEHPYEFIGEYSSGPQKHSFVVHYRKKYVRVDLFKTTITEKPFALLHYTGNVAFNVRTRAHAKRQGYKLNQHGLYKMINGKEAESMSATSEKHILDIIGVTYKPPEERNE